MFTDFTAVSWDATVVGAGVQMFAAAVAAAVVIAAAVDTDTAVGFLRLAKDEQRADLALAKGVEAWAVAAAAAAAVVVAAVSGGAADETAAAERVAVAAAF